MKKVTALASVLALESVLGLVLASIALVGIIGRTMTMIPMATTTAAREVQTVRVEVHGATVYSKTCSTCSTCNTCSTSSSSIRDGGTQSTIRRRRTSMHKIMNTRRRSRVSGRVKRSDRQAN